MNKEQEKEIPICPICEKKMIVIQACHLRCNNCGAELTCSDKGHFW
jgi:transcription initiation factor IIE alpha subunit